MFGDLMFIEVVVEGVEIDIDYVFRMMVEGC